MIEPKIQIGDHVLTEPQAMAVRVAVTDFQSECASEEGRSNLGPIADGYAVRLAEVLKIIFSQPGMR